MLIDLHAHTSRYSSCSRIDPVNLVRLAVRRGLRGLVITEHDRLWSPSELDELRKQAGADDGFLLLSGQEKDTEIGHVLVYGADQTIEGRLRLSELRKRFPEAALVWAHPLRSGRMPRESRLLNPCLDAVEIFNSNLSPREHYLGLMLWHRLKFTAVSGSDTHAADTAAILPTIFDHPVSTIGELAGEIRQGRCRPLYRETAKSGSNLLVGEVVLGTRGGGESRRRIMVKRARHPDRWDVLRESAETLRQVHESGFSEGRFRVPTLIDIDEKDRFILEEGQRGRSLYDLLIEVHTGVGEEYFRLAAQWIARLHASRITLGTAQQTGVREHHRYDAYLQTFEKTGSPHLEEARRLVDAVRGYEEILLAERSGEFVLVHGDYHPKNIIIGQDRMQDISTLFVSVVDFGSAMLFHPAFDVGCFISQFRNQFRSYPRLLEQYPAGEFVSAYRRAYGEIDLPSFLETVKVFQIRVNLSIASFLIHVGKGESEDMREVIERSLSLLDELGWP